jgi:hypothetical protein
LPPLLVIIVAVPAATAVTRPLDDTVAIDVLELAQVNVTPLSVLPFWSFATADSCAVAPVVRLTLVGVTAIVVRTGEGAVTFTVEEPDGVELVLVVGVVVSAFAVMATVPVATPVTSPLEDTVAMAVFALDQVNVTPLIVLPY